MRLLLTDGDARQGLPFLKAFKKAGHHITIICFTRLSPGYLSRYPDRRLIFPDIEYAPKEFEEKLFKHLDETKYDVILPFGHFDAKFCVEHKERLLKYALVPIMDYEHFMLAYDKGTTMDFCMKNNIPCPTTYFPEREDVESIISRAKFPLWVKPRIGVGALGQRRINSPQELREYYSACGKDINNIIIQEFIPHTNELVCHTFWDKDSQMKACIILKKPRYFPPTGGTHTALVSVHMPQVVENCKRLFQGLGITGIADADMVIDSRDGQAKFFEINPRVSCGIKIGFFAGINYADMWLKFAYGQGIEPHLEYEKGLYLRNLCQEILWYLYCGKELRRHTDPPFFKFFGKNVVYQTIALDDPLTFIGFVLNMLKRYSSPNARAAKFSKKYNDK